jgi:hypothetical protein
MISDEIRQKFQNIVGRTRLQESTDSCSTIRDHLIEGFGADPTVKSEFEGRAVIKKEQAAFLRAYAENAGIWLYSLPASSEYLTRGGESKVYLAPDKMNVIKVNDAIYYATWLEYFTSIVIHNSLFPQTAYRLIGFIEDDGNLCVALEQPFIEGQQANLEDISELLTFNGFTNTRRQDYFNQEFGLLLEDMHDENVISRQGILFFIDTVFYVVETKCTTHVDS